MGVSGYSPKIQANVLERERFDLKICARLSKHAEAAVIFIDKDC